jgi:hypothetical protein
MRAPRCLLMILPALILPALILPAFILPALILPVTLLLAGCHPAMAPFVAVGAEEAASVAVFGRGGVDMAYSALSGRDCSIVRLDRGESYCRPREIAPPPQPFCTRTLGVAECFTDPDKLPDQPPALQDGPPGPTLKPRRKPGAT